MSDPGRYIERYSRPDKIAFGLDRADAWPVKFWDTDTAMACMLLLLAAVDAGLGGWLFGIPHGEAELRREFGIPDDRNVVGVVGLGYAGVDEKPARLRVLTVPTTARRDDPSQRLVAHLTATWCRLPAAASFSITSSMPKLDGSWRGGKSLNGSPRNVNTFGVRSGTNGSCQTSNRLGRAAP